MNHTAECYKIQQKYELRREQWIRRWPKYCRKCEASGIAYHGHVSVPYGSGSILMADYDDCPECMGLGLCPRCGGDIYEHLGGVEYDAWLKVTNAVCPLCGWENGAKESDYPPYLYDCYGECLYDD
jgi:hypothetical protein